MIKVLLIIIALSYDANDDDLFMAEFEIEFISDTPLINDLTVILSFTSTIPVDEATCSVSPRLGSVDCKITLIVTS